MFERERLERWIHLNMALVGGFIGGFSILNHHDLFGSAQTANMITLALEFTGRERTDLLLRLGGLLCYIMGLAATVILPMVFRINMKYLSIVVDFVSILIVGFLPRNLPDFVALYPLFLSMSIQWCSFKGAEGYVSSTIFSTNNLRQCVTSYVEYLCSKDVKSYKKAKLYGKVLLSFHIGAALSCVCYLVWGVHGVWCGLIPLLPAAVLVFVEQSHVPVWRVRLWLGLKWMHPAHLRSME